MVFKGWCHINGHIPFQCPVGVILSFLQDVVDKGKAFSIVKVYLATVTWGLGSKLQASTRWFAVLWRKRAGFSPCPDHWYHHGIWLWFWRGLTLWSLGYNWPFLPQVQVTLSTFLLAQHSAVFSLFWLTKQKNTTLNTKHTTLNTI